MTRPQIEKMARDFLWSLEAWEDPEEIGMLADFLEEFAKKVLEEKEKV